MDPFSIAFLLFMGIAVGQDLGEENKSQDAIIESQRDEIASIVEQLNRLSVSHAAVAAREVANHEIQRQKIISIELEIEKAYTE